MKPFSKMSVAILVGGVVGVAASGIQHLPPAFAALHAADERAVELEALAHLRESQRLATADLIARLADGRMSLTEVVDVLETNARGQSVFLSQLELGRSEMTDRERLAGFATDRLSELKGGDHDSASTITNQGIR